MAQLLTNPPQAIVGGFFFTLRKVFVKNLLYLCIIEMNILDNTILYFAKPPFKHLGDMDYVLLATEDKRVITLDEQPNPICIALCDNTPTIDVFHRWGCFVKEGDYKTLLEPPTYKKFATNDWHEFDGLEPLCESMKLNTSKDITIPLYFTNTQRLMEFFQFFGNNSEITNASTLHTCIFEDLEDRTYQLRLKSYGGLNTFIDISYVNVTFSWDNIPTPTAITRNVARHSLIPNQDYALCYNDTGYSDISKWQVVPLRNFGIAVLDGSDESVLQPPALKQNVSVGSEYDDSYIVYASKDTTLKLMLKADDWSDFFDKFDDLFFHLTQKNADHVFALQTPFTVGNYAFAYYKSLKIDKLQPTAGGHIWCEMTLVITNLDDRPTNDDDIILGTEDGKLLAQELPKDDVNNAGVYKYLNKYIYYSLNSPFAQLSEQLITIN